MAANIITLSDAKTFLNITGTVNDAELANFISTASDMIVSRIGPVAGSPTYDEWYDGGSPQILLRHTPIQSITSVNESWYGQVTYTLTPQVLDDGLAKSIYGYTVDVSEGILTRRQSGAVGRFAPGLLNVHVVYVAGYAVVPSELQMAAKILLKHYWAERRGGSKRPGQGGDDMADLRNEGDFPARVEEILANFYIPGIA